MASLEVENALVILEIASRVGNLILLLILTYPVRYDGRRSGVKIRLFWKVVLRLPIVTALLLFWVCSFLVSPLLLPYVFQFELFNEIIANWAGIIFPIIPSGLVIIALLSKYYPPIKESFRDDFIHQGEVDGTN
ncbi:MAG: hypothetical protein JW779_05770 [Candidatus Thorarchaeota archaeon]|nr:hypothetical protein [Candidatus Thorarchaeota archaeon]